MSKKYLHIAACLVCLLLTMAAQTSFAQDVERLTLLHMNDIHAHYLPYTEKGTEGQIGGLAKAESVIRNVTQANETSGTKTMVLFAGDLLTGTPFSMVFKGKMGVELLNSMNFTAMTVGNHEFDYGLENLLENLKPAMKFPLLSANITDSDGKPLFDAVMETKLPDSDTRVVIIGLTTADTPVTTHPKNVTGLVFSDPIAAAKKILENVTDKDVVIALTHLGVEEDKKLAAACPRIDVIVGGHSHTALQEPLLVDKTIITQAGAYAKYVGKLDLEILNGQVTNYKNELVFLGPDVPEDPVIAATVADYKANLDSQFSKVVGHSKVFLDGTRRNLRSGVPTNLGKLITYVMASGVQAEVGLINGGAIREGINEGDITLNDVYTVLPFADNVVKLKMTGKELQAVVQRSLDLEAGSGGKLQTFGVTYAVRDGKAKISKVRGKNFEPNATYSVAINDFLAAGGDGYTAFKDASASVNSGSLVTDLFIDSIKSREINPSLIKEVTKMEAKN